MSDEASPLLLSIDDMIESCMTGHRMLHLLPSLLVTIVWIFDAQQTFISVFTDAEPKWHCQNPNDPICISSLSPCNLDKDSWAWDMPTDSSVVSEWDLQCSAPALVSLPASAFFMGCLVGGLLLSTLADSIFGRKRLLVFSCLAMSMAGISAVFSPNIWIYSATRFICGFSRATVGTCAMVLSTEIVGKKWREIVSIVSYVCFTLGFLSLPMIAYLCRMMSWRFLYLWTSIPSLCYAALVYFLVPESPRWLLVRGRKDEAVQTLKKIATLNGNLITSNFSKLQCFDEPTCKTGMLSTMKMLWERKWARKRLTAIMTISFGVGLSYFGMPLNVGNLGSNLYLSVALNAVAEFPATLLTFFLVGKINRRSSLLALTTISGICSLFCLMNNDIIPERVQMVIEVVSFFGACTCCDIILIYTIELFPTCVRNSALALIRQALVLGGVLAPVLVVKGRNNKFWSFGVFGLAIFCCGLFTVCLPETRGRTICDTIEEEEFKEANPARDEN
ncbi:Organic cation/carnitine transporter 2 [Rhynchospora pubera]|uniref:H(+)/Pi cotransporter n=1 Tax=Rhynchospora pubera TaxID=906938 RepID=A0AAV8GBK7_9POAL|nr:Organic cation/carnitine transporter 2 [Rhynchospora pubera]KAJ4801595.1 Organic cation/carnitine transporter 2 [Rhynchospora pubera]